MRALRVQGMSAESDSAYLSSTRESHERLRIIAWTVLGLCACSDNPASPRAPLSAVNEGPKFAALASTTSDVFPVEIAQFVPCANGGAGEIVVVSAISTRC